MDIFNIPTAKQKKPKAAFILSIIALSLIGVVVLIQLYDIISNYDHPYYISHIDWIFPALTAVLLIVYCKNLSEREDKHIIYGLIMSVFALSCFYSSLVNDFIINGMHHFTSYSYLFDELILASYIVLGILHFRGGAYKSNYIIALCISEAAALLNPLMIYHHFSIVGLIKCILYIGAISIINIVIFLIGYNSFVRKKVTATVPYYTAPQPIAQPMSPPTGVEAELLSLQKSFALGVISEEEFEAAKVKLLNDLANGSVTEESKNTENVYKSDTEA
ncbi:MAG: hypothetical protein IJW19_00625 [Clostridia bacterium]|nr:hypothetical protein [Clostridia bacterium]